MYSEEEDTMYVSKLTILPSGKGKVYLTEKKKNYLYQTLN